MGMSFCSGRVDSISWPPLSISKAVFVSMLLVARPQLYLVIEQPCSFVGLQAGLYGGIVYGPETAPWCHNALI